MRKGLGWRTRERIRIKRLYESVHHSVQLYWRSHPGWALYDLARLATSLTVFQKRELMSIPRRGLAIVEIRNTAVVEDGFHQGRNTPSRREAVHQKLRQSRRQTLRRWCKSDSIRQKYPCRQRQVRTDTVGLVSIQSHLVECVWRGLIIRYNDCWSQMTYDIDLSRTARRIWKMFLQDRRRSLNISRQMPSWVLEQVPAQ